MSKYYILHIDSVKLGVRHCYVAPFYKAVLKEEFAEFSVDDLSEFCHDDTHDYILDGNRFTLVGIGKADENIFSEIFVKNRLFGISEKFDGSDSFTFEGRLVSYEEGSPYNGAFSFECEIELKKLSDAEDIKEFIGN
ncbi:MAG: hypothetical protein ACPG5O_15300 [Pseudoalteromonas tetraodonis]